MSLIWLIIVYICFYVNNQKHVIGFSTVVQTEIKEKIISHTAVTRIVVNKPWL